MNREEDVPPLPPKLGKNASEEEKTEREKLMQLRRKLKERIRDQGRDRKERKRTKVDEATEQRAVLRALAAPAIALDAVEKATVPVDHDEEGSLNKLIDQALAKFEDLDGMACEASKQKSAARV